ncbi:MAG: hypothetical protein CMH30_07645 [Micavibrio sp.]|nr:hypothetical protein [Micavibrio sp.]
MGGSITVNSMIIAESNREQIWLKSLLAGYELNFNFSLQGLPERNGKKRWATISTARVHAKTAKSREYDLGLAHLETPLSVETHPDRSIHAQITFHLPLVGAQLSKLEEIRDGHDIEFKIMIKGIGGDGEYTNPVHDEWRVKISRSDWVDRLKQADYMDILLLEVPMLPKDVSDEWIDIKEHLEEAQKHFVNREYRACVSTCRDVIQETGQMRYGKKSWSNVLLDKLDKNARNEMNKEDRAGAIWGALRHYTHQAHHSKSEGGEKLYTRSEAKLALILTAAFVNYG